MYFTKYRLPDHIIGQDEACISWVAYDVWEHIGWETKRFVFAKMLHCPSERYSEELCIAVVVKKSEMMERGYIETERGFLGRLPVAESGDML